MTKTVTIEQAKWLYGGSITELAKALNYSRNAIYKMGDNLSERAYLKLRFVLKPEWFKPDGTLRKKPA